MKQIDIWGNETEPFYKVNTNISIKERFRRKNGYKNGFKCSQCKYHHRFDYNNKYFHKCEKMGISHSTATDIRLKDEACNLFEERE